MKVLYVASEALPFVASGGLADVAGSLPFALRKRLVGTRVVLPLYAKISDEMRSKMKYICNFPVPVSWRMQYCGIFEAHIGGVIYYMVMGFISWLRVPTDGLKLFTALIVAAFLAVPYLKGKASSSFRKAGRRGADDL